MDGDYSNTTNVCLAALHMDSYNHYCCQWQALLDHESYYLNLTDANLRNKAEWKFEYSAKAAYGLESLQPQEWASLIQRLKTDDQLFQKFWE